MYCFYTNALAYHGLSGSALTALSALLALSAMAVIFIRPIPIKPAAVFVLYLGFFSGLLALLSLPMKLLKLPDLLWGILFRSGWPALGSSLALILYGYIHGKRVTRTAYCIETDKDTPLRIAFLSDIHMGKSIDPAAL